MHLYSWWVFTSSVSVTTMRCTSLLLDCEVCGRCHLKLPEFWIDSLQLSFVGQMPCLHRIGMVSWFRFLRSSSPLHFLAAVRPRMFPFLGFSAVSQVLSMFCQTRLLPVMLLFQFRVCQLLH
jgi:hypothetical protein